VKLKAINEKNNFYYLFFALVFMLCTSSIVATISDDNHYYIFDLLTISMLLISIKSLKNDKTLLWALGVLIIISSVIFVSNQFFTYNYTEFITLFIWLVFFIGSFTTSVKGIISSKEIDQNMIVGSIVLYLLLGLIYTTIYLFILRIFSGAFHGLEYISLIDSFTAVSYYSFVTLTTLGYGDIYPQIPFARFIVASEAVVGVFYLTIIVSSLVSARINTISKK